jgi:transposase InsO family protein
VRKEILQIVTSDENKDLTPWKIIPKLVDEKGLYIASESSFYRILKEEKLLAHRGRSKAKTMERPAPLIAKGPNEIWSWDISYMKGPIRGQFYYLYMFMDIFSRKIVGYEVHETESMELSAALVDKICKKENIKKDQLILHSDNGGPMKGSTMLVKLYDLGVVPSFSRPSISDDNPFSESLFKTVKYCPKYPVKGFSSLAEAREWVKSFVDWYNNEHLHSGIKFVTPSQRHEGTDKKILENRKEVYENAKIKNPLRWSGKIKNFDWIEEVSLNHLKGKEKCDTKKSSKKT